MQISKYENFGDHHFGVAAMEGVRLDGFTVLQERDDRILYALATVVSNSTGEVYMLRYKRTSDGEQDTVCSCPACSHRQYFCKHQAVLLDAVTAREGAEWEHYLDAIDAQADQEESLFLVIG